MSNCPNCNKETNNPKYCSMECYYDFRRKIVYERDCLSCGKKIIFKNGAYARLDRMRYCSHECKNRKFTLDESYFSGELDKEKLITLGQFITCGEIASHTKIRVISDKKTLNDIKNKLNCTYKITISDRNLFRIDIKSIKMVSDLIDLGLHNNRLYQDVPRNDIWEGMKSTHCYVEIGNKCIFRTESSRISKWIEDCFGASTITSLFKNDFKNVVGCYYINMWKKNI